MEIEELAIATDRIRTEAHQQVIDFVQPTLTSFETALKTVIGDIPITSEERGILYTQYLDSFSTTVSLIYAMKVSIIGK